MSGWISSSGTKISQFPAGESYVNPVIALDLMPAFLSLAGIDPQTSDQFDGVNLIPYLTKEKEGKPHESFMWRFTISTGIIEKNCKLIRLPDRLPLLFDLDTDISAQHNVALLNMEVRQRLLKKLGEWDLSLPHPVFLEGPEWKVNQRNLYDAAYETTQAQNR